MPGLWAQVNLVPNPSFEEYTDCPCNGGMVSFAEPWFIAWGSPDYFNACNNTINNCENLNPNNPIPMGLTAVPINGLGNQNAFDGLAYMGMLTKPQNNDGQQFREYIGVPLKQKLTGGRTYCYSFYVSLADSAQFTGKEIQIALGPVADFNASDFSEFGQTVIPNTNDSLFNKLGWFQISGEFTAIGGETYLFIGNFLDAAQSTLVPDTSNSSNWQTGIYPFVDMVSLFDCDNTQQPIIPNIFTPDGNGVNDFWEVADSNQTIAALQIFNRWGTPVFKYEGNGSIIWDGKYNGNTVSTGTYFYVLRYRNAGNKEEFENGIITVVY